MTAIQQRERQKYDDLLLSVEQYGAFSPAERYLPVFLSLIGEARGTVLDAGCCTGKGGLFLQAHGFDVTLCDLTPSGLVDEARTLPFVQGSIWQDLSSIARAKGHPCRTRFDYVVCCDVLEHLPTHFTMLAIEQLLRVTRHALFLSIGLVPDVFGVWTGTRLHQTVEPFQWWRDAIRELGHVTDARDLRESATFLVEPR